MTVPVAVPITVPSAGSIILGSLKALKVLNNCLDREKWLDAPEWVYQILESDSRLDFATAISEDLGRFLKSDRPLSGFSFGCLIHTVPPCALGFCNL